MYMQYIIILLDIIGFGFVITRCHLKSRQTAHQIGLNHFVYDFFNMQGTNFIMY